MGRPKRAADGRLVYHVLNRANARMTVFEKPEDYRAFVPFATVPWSTLYRAIQRRGPTTLLTPDPNGLLKVPTLVAEEWPMTRLLILLTAPILNCENVPVHDLCEDRRTLQGTWRVRSALICGTPFEGGYRDNKVLLVFSGQLHRFGNYTRGDGFEPAKYSLAWEEGRKTVRFYDAATGDVRWKAIYAFEGNTLLLKMPPKDTPERRKSVARGSMKWEDSGVTLVLTRGEGDLPAPGVEEANQKKSEGQKERTTKVSPEQDPDDPFRVIETPLRSEGERTKPASPSAHRRPISRHHGRYQRRTKRSGVLPWRCRRLGKIKR